MYKKAYLKLQDKYPGVCAIQLVNKIQDISPVI